MVPALSKSPTFAVALTPVKAAIDVMSKVGEPIEEVRFDGAVKGTVRIVVGVPRLVEAC